MKTICPRLIAASLALALALAGCAKKSPSVPPLPAHAATQNHETTLSLPSGANSEEYASTGERGFVSPAVQPLSTFSSDVDTASYSNIRRMITNGQPVPADAVRVEEMINYFRYEYPAPAAEDPLALSAELGTCPWNKDHLLAQIGIAARTVDKEQLPSSNMVFLIDVSGSMHDANKLPLLREAFLLLTEQLRAQDRVSIVVYAGQDSVLLSGATGEDKVDIAAVLDSLTAGGSTGGSRGILTAYALAEEYYITGGNNRVILATDGDFNVGITSEAELRELIEEQRENGVYLSVLGFGMGNLKDNKLESLADHGNGNYAYIDTIEEAHRVFVEQFGSTLFAMAKDVKIQVEFNSVMVKGYRLIGYDNRRLNDEDFTDDRKDAGDMGPGHTVTALYEIIPASSDEEVPGARATRDSEAADAESNDWFTVSIRYKTPDGDTGSLLSLAVPGSTSNGTLSDNMRLAAAVAEFGLLLRGSAHAGSSSREQILSLLAPLAHSDSGDAIGELRRLVRQARID